MVIVKQQANNLYLATLKMINFHSTLEIIETI